MDALKLGCLGVLGILSGGNLAPVSAQSGGTNSPNLLVRCPHHITLSAKFEDGESGWFDYSVHRANFQLAEVIYGSQSQPALLCSYSVPQTTTVAARIVRSVPDGLRCSVNGAVPSQFDCVPGEVPRDVNRIRIRER